MLSREIKMMRKLLPVVAISSLLGFAACTDGYGNYDPVATGFLAAGAAVAAVAVGVAASQPHRGGYYRQPSYGYGYGYGYGRPVYHQPYYGHRRGYW